MYSDGVMCDPIKKKGRTEKKKKKKEEEQNTEYIQDTAKIPWIDFGKKYRDHLSPMHVPGDIDR